MNGIYLYNNPYGFRLNINHPLINDLYRRYKRWKGLTGHFPITDEQRREFENYIFQSKKITPRKTKIFFYFHTVPTKRRRCPF